jgi:hypothetical protein
LADCAHDIDNLGWVAGAKADDVAQTPDLVGMSVFDRAENAVESRQIAVESLIKATIIEMML